MSNVLNLREQDPTWANGTVLGILLGMVVAIGTAGLVTVFVRGSHISSPVTSPGMAPTAERAAAADSVVPAIGPGDSPVRLRIPAIGVDAPLVPLGVDTEGALEVPRYEEVGWYAGGSRPGEAGPAVIAAHVDSYTGPAVFYRLDDLQPGDEVEVEYPNVTVSFVIWDAERVGKSDFPTQRVYGPTTAPELRLVTCAGAFDRRTRSYASNLIVWADLLIAT